MAESIIIPSWDAQPQDDQSIILEKRFEDGGFLAGMTALNMACAILYKRKWVYIPEACVIEPDDDDTKKVTVRLACRQNVFGKKGAENGEEDSNVSNDETNPDTSGDAGTEGASGDEETSPSSDGGSVDGSDEGHNDGPDDGPGGDDPNRAA